MIKGKKILLGVTASIAAYKATYIVRLLKKLGASVRVIQTEASLDFVTPLVLSTLSENNVIIDVVDKETTVVTVELLSKPYADHILNHLKRFHKQGNSNSSEFLNACRSKLQGDMSECVLLKVTRKKGFVNVVDAFQYLSGGIIRKNYTEKIYNRQSKRLVITDNLLALKEQYQYQNL